MASKHLKYPNKQFTQIASIDERLSALESALLVDQKYETPWTVCTAWTAGASVTINHNLNTPFEELSWDIKIRDPSSPTKVYSGNHQIFYLPSGSTGDYGQIVNGITGNNNAVRLQIANMGARIIADTSAGLSFPTTWEYKVIITTNRTKTFINSIYDTSLLNRQIATAWVNFDGSTNVGGYCTHRDSFNVLNVADGGVGKYTINFETLMNNANYAYDITMETRATSGLLMCHAIDIVATTSYLKFDCYATSNGQIVSVIPADSARINVMIFGGMYCQLILKFYQVILV